MIDKIQIVSWLLTRRCNLKCSYCAITRNYKGKPDQYPDMKHYLENEMDTKTVIEILRRIKAHNPDAFHILYGGEPLLRKDLPEIVNFCNSEDIHYTIITNNSDEVQPLLEKLLVETDYVTGLTSSVDPLVESEDPESDRYKKCVAGFNRLGEYRDVIKDVVAEITVDNNNVGHLYNLVAMLTKMGVNSDITFIDIAKSPYYDFSNVTDEGLLVPQSDELSLQFDKIIDDKLDVHMADKLLPEIFKILPSDMDCGIENNIHNMTIDADGSVRLCLRIRGVQTPKFKAIDQFSPDGKLMAASLRKFIKHDKDIYCRGCNWTCMLMSRMLSRRKDTVQNLVHRDRRK